MEIFIEKVLFKEGIFIHRLLLSFRISHLSSLLHFVYELFFLLEIRLTCHHHHCAPEFAKKMLTFFIICSNKAVFTEAVIGVFFVVCKKNCLPFSQYVPIKPSSQRQLQVSSLQFAKHVPPFWHGEEEQGVCRSSKTFYHKTPVYRG